LKDYNKGDLSKEQKCIGGPDETEDFSDLIGSTILDVGFHSECTEGGLTIDYLKEGNKKRVVFGYNELGLWKEWEGPLNNV
jgi:hypothetical protein